MKTASGWMMLATGLAVATLATTSVRGEEEDKTEQPLDMAAEIQRAKEAMAALPSEPGPHIEKIKAMGDDEWLDLGAPAPDPKWGSRRGASYTSKMAFAPDLRGAFVTGEGPHARAHWPDIMTDLFFYDINAHAWICAAPPFHFRTQKLTVDENGFEVDETGQPLPYTMGHGWQQFDYIRDTRQFIGVWPGVTHSMRIMRPLRKAWTEGKELAAKGHPWFWDVASGRWERHITTGDVPTLKEHNHVVQYVPAMKSTFYFQMHTNLRGIYRFDHGSNHWTQVGSRVDRDNKGCVALDTKRTRLYVAHGGKAYDFETGEWHDLAGAKIWKQFVGPTSANLTYDSANDVVVAYRYYTRPGWKDPDNYVRIYDAAADAWLDEKREGPPGNGGVNYAQYNAFYDPELNVHFMYAASDGSSEGKMWAYRYKRTE